MKDHYELVVIGAGPAGLAAATTCAKLGIDIVLLDEQPAPGGQIYRAIETSPSERTRLLGADYRAGATLVQAFRDSGATYLPNTSVWSLSHRNIGILQGGKACRIRADQVIIAGGAMERPVPLPGWTLPGVMNAGAAQILLKGAGAVPDDGVVIAGTGPLLLLLAWQYMHAGVAVKAVLEQAGFMAHLRAAPRLPSALLAGHYITRGMKYLLDLRRAGVPIYYGVSDIRAKGEKHVEAVEYRHRGKSHRIDTEHLFLHYGLIPNIQLTEAAGCQHAWNPAQQCWVPVTNSWGNTSIDWIHVAGDNASIGGALSATHAGRLAALNAARALGKINTHERDKQSRNDRSWMRSDLRIRPFLEALHNLPISLLATPDDSTIVCRCEEITAGAIRRAVAEGHRDPNQVKFITRCGMGPCQGRQCAQATAHIVAAQLKQSVAARNPFRIRPPVRPLTIGALANLDNEDSS